MRASRIPKRKSLITIFHQAVAEDNSTPSWCKKRKKTPSLPSESAAAPEENRRKEVDINVDREEEEATAAAAVTKARGSPTSAARAAVARDRDNDADAAAAEEARRLAAWQSIAGKEKESKGREPTTSFVCEGTEKKKSRCLSQTSSTISTFLSLFLRCRRSASGASPPLSSSSSSSSRHLRPPPMLRPSASPTS